MVNKMKNLHGKKNETFKNKSKTSFHTRANDSEEDFEQYEDPKKWFDEILEDPTNSHKCTEQILIELKDEAQKCHDSEVANYNIKNSKTNSKYQWMKTIMSKGTVSDKIAAHTISIQDNPICNLEKIRNLVGMVKVGKKKECIAVIDTLRELFLSDLLRPNQKLKAFHQRPLSMLNQLSSGNAVTRRKLLSLWYFEDQLKEIYTQFVLALNTVAQDTVDSNKEKAISAMYKLLAGNPEQEKNLLSYIVNKLGDPSQKVASKAIYCLTQLLFEHANMQAVVLNEIEKLLFRSNISNRSQYYSLCFLSQFHLSHDASDIARKLIEGEVDSRMMSALLMGINRAYPYAKLEFDKISEHIDTIYKLVHLAGFNIALQALTLLYQVSDVTNNVTDRFYSALYRKLADPKVLSTTHQAMLLSLIYKALLKDTEVNRIKMFIKRLLQISLYTQPGFSCGILYLISQLISKKEHVQALILKPKTVTSLDEDDGEERYHDVKEEITDVQDWEATEIKQEIEDVEVKAEDTEENKKQPNMSMQLIEIKDEDTEVKPDVEALETSLSASWYHCQNGIKRENAKSRGKYNPLVRNPLYGGGEFCAYTELYSLKSHFHPTVALYASNILDGDTVKYSGDPLKDFTLIRFLERFVFKNPRKVEEKVGIDPTFGKRKLYRPKGVKLMSVNSAGYLRETLQNIPEDELFVYSYLQRKYQHRKIYDKEHDSDLESVQSEEFEELLEKMSGIKDDAEDIDYMHEIGDSLKKKNKKKKTSEKEGDGDEEEEEDANFTDDESVENGDFSDDYSDDELGDLGDEDMELIDGLDDDVEDMEFIEDDKPQKKKFKKKGKNLSSVFASAEEFSTLLEDEGNSKVKPGGSNVFSNKDNANAKQIAWEDKRNTWLKGFSKAVGGGSGKKFGSKGKQFGKKRPPQSNFGNKHKKLKN